MKTNQNFLSITDEHFTTIASEKWSFQKIQTDNKTTIIATNECGITCQFDMINLPKAQELRFFGYIIK